MNKLRRLFRRYSRCVVAIETQDSNGDLGIGTGFHVGSGIVVTARHVLEGRQVTQVIPARDGHQITVRTVGLPKRGSADIALLETDFDPHRGLERTSVHKGDEVVPATQLYERYIPIGGHLDDWIDDGLILTKCLVMGYPPIPTATDAVLVVAEAEVHADVNRFNAQGVHFVLSGPPRGGFSGGPAISEFGFLLGMVVDAALRSPNQPVETGYLMVISVETILSVLTDWGHRPMGVEDEVWQLFSDQ